MKKQILKMICAAMLVFTVLLSGCSKDAASSKNNATDTNASAASTSDYASKTDTSSDSTSSQIVVQDDLLDKVTSELKITRSAKEDTEHKVGYQLDMPSVGDDIAIIETSLGTIKMRFFPEAAPKAVENFITHAKDGYYNGLKFHRVINDFMVQTGDPNGDGTGGKSIWDSSFEDEFSTKLFNIRGAVSMANSGYDTNGSQFFINQIGKDAFKTQTEGKGLEAFKDMRDSYLEGLQYYYDYSMAESFVNNYGTYLYDYDKTTDEIKKLYDENGGNPYLDGAFNLVDRGHTVFGQVYEGLDTVDAIAAVEVDENYAPKADVLIKSITISKYEG